MEQFNLADLILLNRENLKSNTLAMYLGNLKTLNDKKEITSLEFLFNFDEIMDKLQKYKLRTQRNYLTSVLVALGVYNTSEYNELREKYRKVLEGLTTQMNAEIELHTKNQTQDENWSSLNELKKSILCKYKRDVKRFGLPSRASPTQSDIFLYQKYVIAALYLLRPPVRLDYAGMRVIRSRDEIEEGKNYLLVQSDRRKIFIFGDFKNVRIIGVQEQAVGSAVNKILNVWLNKYNKTGTLLLNSRMGALSPNGLGKLITEVFSTDKKRVSLNLIRHIWASENVDLEQTMKQNEIAAAMMHTSKTQLEYVKK